MEDKAHESSDKVSMLENNLFSEPAPIFCGERELYVAFGSNISIYNPVGGSLLRVLKGHKHKIVSLCKSKIEGKECIISCDRKGFVFFWYTDKDEAGNNSSLKLPLKREFFVDQFIALDNKYFFTSHLVVANTAKLWHCCGLPPSLPPKIIERDIKIGPHKIAVSPDLAYAAALTENKMIIIFVSPKKRGKKCKVFHYTGKRPLLSVFFHPTKEIIATGAQSGAIILWFQFLDSIPVKTFLHWHSLPLYSMCFSTSGNDLYSGSGECVLVRWRLSEGNKKSFLPRLGSPICAIQTDSQDAVLAIRHLDSSLSFINSQEMKFLGIIRNLCFHLPHDKKLVHSVGLTYHPPTGSLIANGRSGHLQFFTPQTKKVVYSLDVSLSNFVTKLDEKILPNNEVTKLALSEDGLWLATTEIIELSSFTEVTLKFWHYSLENQRWEMNTNIFMPHSDVINSMTMSPLTKKDKAPTCVSCSEDGKFTIWMFFTYRDPQGRPKTHWSSCFTRDFKGYAATACAFSADGSLLAVAFENIITFWTPKSCTLVGSLSQPYLKERICDIAYSSAECEGSYIVTRSPSYLCSWNLLTCSLHWRVFIQTTCMAADRASSLMAAFSDQNEVFLFEPHSSQPFSAQKNLCDVNILCASFVHLTNKSGKLGASLCLFDFHQNFYHLEDIVATTEISPLDDQVDSEPEQEMDSGIYSALVAKSLTEFKRKINDDSAPVIPANPAINKFRKEMEDIRTHNLAFEGLLNHIQSFLPDLKLEPSNDKEKTKLKYSTIQDESERMKNPSWSFRSREVALLDDPQCETLIQKLDYSEIVNKL